MSEIEFKNITSEDIEDLKAVQPEDWPDITPSIKFYLESDFCTPIKVVQNSEIVGIGACIFFQNTAWLAHIIVNQNHRNKGIGSLIVNHLLKLVKSKSIETALLIATALGEPIYKKAGFEKVTDYIFLKREKELPQFELNKNVITYLPEFKDEILQMDSEILGEKREPILSPHLKDAYLYVDNLQLLGYYLPTLGDGMLVAKDENAGLELLKLRCLVSNKIVIPKENFTAYNYLLDIGYKEYDKGTRMVYGKPISWVPQNYYSRIGGYLG